MAQQVSTKGRCRLAADLSLYAYDSLVLACDFLQLLYQLLQVLHTPASKIFFYEILFGLSLGRFTELLQIGLQSWQQCRRRLFPYQSQHILYLLALLCLYFFALGIARDQTDGSPGQEDRRHNGTHGRSQCDVGRSRRDDGRVNGQGTPGSSGGQNRIFHRFQSRIFYSPMRELHHFQAVLFLFLLIHVG